MTKYKYDEYIAVVKNGKCKSVMDLNVDELREELCRTMDILEAIDENTTSIDSAIQKWRMG